MTEKDTQPTAIDVTVGPYAGKTLAVSPADAKAAISEGWAKDPSAPPPEKEPAPLTDEQRAEVMAKAEKAARKLRGEEEPEQHGEKPRELAPKPSSGYETRTSSRASRSE